MLRILTLNLQHGQPGAGAGDGSASAGSLARADIRDPRTARAVLAALAEQLAELAPDIVALQEVDLHQPRSGRLDQVAVLAEFLGWEHHRFAATYAGPIAGLRRRPLRSALESPADDILGPARALTGAKPAGFGNALLSRHRVGAWRIQRLGRGPATVVRRGDNPLDPRSYRLFTATARSLLVAAIEPGAVPGIGAMTVGAAHLATRREIASAQLAAAWSALATLPGPHVLAGDLNLRAEHLAALGVARPVGEGPTYPASGPAHRIDHVLTDPWPTDANGLPLATAQAAGAPAWAGPERPLLRAVGGGARSLVVSDHACTWVDLEPVAG